MDFSYVSWATLGKGFRFCQYDSTLGIAPGSTFVKALKDYGVITDPIISIGGIGGVALGWIGTYNATPFITYQNYIPEWPLWTLNLTDIKIDNYSFGFNGIAVLNSASWYSEFPLVVADSLAYFLGMERSDVIDGRQYYISPNSSLVNQKNFTVSLNEDQ